jgi:hypothetical protein
VWFHILISSKNPNCLFKVNSGFEKSQQNSENRVKTNIFTAIFILLNDYFILLNDYPILLNDYPILLNDYTILLNDYPILLHDYSKIWTEKTRGVAFLESAGCGVVLETRYVVVIS